MGSVLLLETAVDRFLLQDGTSFILLEVPDDSYKQLILGTTGLVSYWRLGESSGTSAVDQKGTNNGTYIASPTLGVTGSLTVAGDTAVAFNGSTQYVTVAHSASLNLGDGPLTIEAWVKPTNIGVNGAILGKFTGGYYLRHNNTGFLEFLASQVAVVAHSNTNMAINTWYHVAGTKTGATTILYINGVASTVAVTPTTLVDNAIAVGIGSNGGGSIAEPYPGTLDEVALYNVVLTPQQILDRYNYGINTARRFPNAPPVLQAMNRAATR